MLVAEIGQNHCGDMELAKDLIRIALWNGADLAKFQLYDKSIGDNPLTKEQAKELFDFGRKIGIQVFFSVFDVERVEWCKEIGVNFYKIAYSERDNLPLMKALPDDKVIIISTDYRNGHAIYQTGKQYYCIRTLYCVSKYPAQLQEVALDKALEGRYRYDGYSDHTIGLDAAKLAFAWGADIVEKHFAIDHKIGVDAEWSMTPEELKELKRWEGVCRGFYYRY